MRYPRLILTASSLLLSISAFSTRYIQSRFAQVRQLNRRKEILKQISSKHHPPHHRSLTTSRRSLPKSKTTTRLQQSGTPSDAEALIESLDEERRQNLFQALLRDLQIEGVAVLGCDADQVHSMSAALWTIISEMSERDDEERVCIVMENIPMGALKAFVQDFAVLKTQGRLMEHLGELGRVSISLVGKGVGPAFLVEVTKRTEAELLEKERRVRYESSLDKERSTAAVKSFVDRAVVGSKACPYTKSSDVAAIGIEAKGVNPGPVGYRFSSSSDVCTSLATFWNCVCELLSTPEEQLSTIILSLPAIGPGTSNEAHDRFSAVVELIGRNLCLYRGDGAFGLVHFHPAYDRNKIQPVNEPSYGHLPPRSWLRPMLRHNGNIQEAENLTDEQLALSDYQRRSPHTAINILRASQLDAASGGKSIVDLDIGGGVTKKASGILTYSRNAITFAGIGEHELKAAVQVEMAMEHQ